MAKKELATFGAGCFWHVQHAFDQIPGVKTTVGYMGGEEAQKQYSYEEVCSGRTGHAEVVQIEFDPKKIPYSELLKVFWKGHDPTQLNRQGLDIGKQYRSVIFYHNEAQKKIALASKRAEQQKLDRRRKLFKKKIVTEIKAAGKFYKAEAYHQKYLEKRGLETCPT